MLFLKNTIRLRRKDRKSLTAEIRKLRRMLRRIQKLRQNPQKRVRTDELYQ
jgi:hypothetical protein